MEIIEGADPKPEKKKRRGSNILLRSLVLCVFICNLPFSITGSIIGSSFGYPQVGSLAGILIGLGIFYLIWPRVSRHAIAFDAHGFKKKHFVWSSKYSIEFNWEFLVSISQKHDINYDVIDQHIFEWFDENNINYQVVLGKLFLPSEEDLIHFKMVWG